MAQFDQNNSAHLVSLKGKKYVTYVGLQALLVDRNLVIISTDTSILQWPDEGNKNTVVVNCEICVQGKGENGKLVGPIRSFKSIGDASPGSVGSNIAPHIIRMAETRAQCRALRLITRSPYTSREEVGEV